MPKITGLSAQQKSSNRVNVLVDGKYKFSLDVFQISDLGIKVGKDYTEAELTKLEEESIFGKLYARTLEYTMIRPHSGREIKDYLRRKTRDTKVRNRQTGEWKLRKGVDAVITERVYDRLVSKGYIDDDKFARYWVENRQQRKGISGRKLEMELLAKGVDRGVIQQAMQNSPRDEKCEMRKIIAKKAQKYTDDKKLIAYLLQQGFNYDDIKSVLAED